MASVYRKIFKNDAFSAILREFSELRPATWTKCLKKVLSW